MEVDTYSMNLDNFTSHADFANTSEPVFCHYHGQYCLGEVVRRRVLRLVDNTVVTNSFYCEAAARQIANLGYRVELEQP